MKCPKCNYRWNMTIWDVKLAMALDALKAESWNRIDAAKRLGVSDRTLRAWVIRLRVMGHAIPDRVKRKPSVHRKRRFTSCSYGRVRRK